MDCRGVPHSEYFFIIGQNTDLFTGVTFENVSVGTAGFWISGHFIIGHILI